METKERLKQNVESYEKGMRKYFSFELTSYKQIAELLNDNLIRKDEIVCVLPAQDKFIVVLYATGYRVDEILKNNMK